MTGPFLSESEDRIANNSVRHQYRVLSEPEKQAMVTLKDWGAGFIADIKLRVPEGREQSLAITKVEEAVMWAVKGLTA